MGLHGIYMNTDEYCFVCLLMIHNLFWNFCFEINTYIFKNWVVFFIIDLEEFFSWLLFVLPCTCFCYSYTVSKSL